MAPSRKRRTTDNGQFHCRYCTPRNALGKLHPVNIHDYHAIYKAFLNHEPPNNSADYFVFPYAWPVLRTTCRSAPLRRAPGRNLALAVSPDGKTLASGGITADAAFRVVDCGGIFVLFWRSEAAIGSIGACGNWLMVKSLLSIALFAGTFPSCSR